MDNELIYVDPAEDDPAVEHAVIQCWVRTAEGAVLFGLTVERGPFDTLDSIKSDIVAALPWPAVEPATLRTRHVIQLTIFD